MKRDHENWGGFTLIELMIVIAILAILAAIAIPAVQDYNNPRAAARRRADFQEHQREAAKPRAESNYRGALSIYTDPDTGCQYIRITGEAGLSPRMNSEGHQICNGGTQ